MTARNWMTSAAAAALLMIVSSQAMTHAQTTVPTPGAAPWVLSTDMGYGYDGNGKTFAYKMGTSNAKLLLKGARKVPRNTLFFLGENGQLYMRSGPFLEDDGRFRFGPG